MALVVSSIYFGDKKGVVKGKKGGRMREKGWEERGPKAHLKNSDFGIPLIQALFSGLPNTGMCSILKRGWFSKFHLVVVVVSMVFSQFLVWENATNHPLLQRKAKGGGNSGEGKTYHKAPPQKRLWSPPITLSFSLEETGADQTNPIFWGLQNWSWRGHFSEKSSRP